MARKQYGKAVDTYSWAITLLEMLSRGWLTRDRGGSKFAACEGWRPTPPPHVVSDHPREWALVQQCWDPEPSQRPDFRSVLAELERCEELGAAASGRN